jgi:hypothetical protein
MFQGFSLLRLAISLLENLYIAIGKPRNDEDSDDLKGSLCLAGSSPLRGRLVKYLYHSSSARPKQSGKQLHKLKKKHNTITEP